MKLHEIIEMAKKCEVIGLPYFQEDCGYLVEKDKTLTNVQTGLTVVEMPLRCALSDDWEFGPPLRHSVKSWLERVTCATWSDRTKRECYIMGYEDGLSFMKNIMV